MEDRRRYRRFFLRPTETYHRQYEALRAVFVEGRPSQEVAKRFGYREATLRCLVYRFRRRVQAGDAPPFFASLPGDDHQENSSRQSRPVPKCQPSRMAAP